MSVTNLVQILLAAILTNNYILSKFLGICPFLGVSKKLDTAVGMSVAVIFVMKGNSLYNTFKLFGFFTNLAHTLPPLVFLVIPLIFLP